MLKYVLLMSALAAPCASAQTMNVSPSKPTGLDVTLYSSAANYTLYPGRPSIWGNLQQDGYVEYTLNSNGGIYTAQVFYSDGNGRSGIVTPLVNGMAQTSLAVVPTGGWGHFRMSAPTPISLPAGRSTFRIAAAMPFHAINLAGVLLTPAPQSDSQPAPSPDNTSPGPLSDAKFYVNPYNAAAKYLSRTSWSDPLLAKIAQQPQGVWFGDWNVDPRQDVSTVVASAARQGAVPVLVAYNLVHRDCGGYSGGGAASGEAYRLWIKNFALGIGDNKAVVILEPDALTHYNTSGCLNDSQKDGRLALLQYAGSMFNQHAPNALVYLDGGPPNGIDPRVMAKTLVYAGIDKLAGFAVNTSNYETTESDLAYGQQISSLTGGKHFVIDTSRNGAGPTWDHQFCNPLNRGLGTPPQGFAQGSLDAYLWVQNPGTSDGSCNGAPPAGEFSVGIAYTLIANSVF